MTVYLQSDDGYPGLGNGDDPTAGGAPQMAEGESQKLSEYPAPTEIKTEDANGVWYNVLWNGIAMVVNWYSYCNNFDHWYTEYNE